VWEKQKSLLIKDNHFSRLTIIQKKDPIEVENDQKTDKGQYKKELGDPLPNTKGKPRLSLSKLVTKREGNIIPTLKRKGKMSASPKDL